MRQDRWVRPAPQAYKRINIAATAQPMITVAVQPSSLWLGVAVKSPMRRLLVTTIIMAAMMGTEMTPLCTALQYRALIGSMG